VAITKYSLRRPNYVPWSELEDMPNRLSRLFDDSMFSPLRDGRWTPAVAVSETNDELMLSAELPGMGENDISIELENNVLTLSGEKSEERSQDDEERRFHIVERSFGSFSRSFTLPRTVDANGIVAKFENGVLTVTLPKVPEAKGRKIEITR
jgi:HSP20 family protein